MKIKPYQIGEPENRYMRNPIPRNHLKTASKLHFLCCDHRDKLSARHKCTGQVTINRDVIQFDCPQCGGGTWLLKPDQIIA